MKFLLFEGRDEGRRERTQDGDVAAGGAATRSDRRAMIAGSTMPSSG
jgi:hypothetical protein